MSYNWQLPDWPEFRYELDGVTEPLLAFAQDARRVGGLLEGLPDELETEAVLDLMIAEAIRSSAIEGETLNRDAVMSSIRPARQRSDRLDELGRLEQSIVRVPDLDIHLQ